MRTLTRIPRSQIALCTGIVLWLGAGAASAQLTDVTQAPNAENAGIQKSLEEEIGAGQGSLTTPDSSIYVIKRDPFRSIRRGRQLFQRKFTTAQGLGPRTGDGIGSIADDGSIGAGISDNCAGCHGRPRGAAGFGGDVATRPDSRDAPHLFGLGLQEMLGDEITADLRAIRDGAIAVATGTGSARTVRLTSKGIDYGSITAFADGSVDTSQVEGVDADLRVRPFFAEGGTVSIREFVVGALNAEMGLEAYDPLLADAVAGNRVVTPAGMVLDGSLDTIEAPPVVGTGDDSDNDGVVDEIDVALIDHFEFYLLNYFKPATYFDDLDDSDSDSLAGVRRPQLDGRDRPGRRAHPGLRRMAQFGCTSCHVQNLEIQNDRRVADVETAYDEENGIFNRLFATAAGLFDEVDDGSGHPTLKQPRGERFVVENFFADLKRHDLGPNFYERNYDGTMQKEFMTEPLWGVGSSPPYGHDGRSINLRSVILRHGGEAQESRDAFARAGRAQQQQLLAFLQSLVLFPPDDTASNLDPGDRTHPDFPQRGHGSIALTVLFNDPSDIE